MRNHAQHLISQRHDLRKAEFKKKFSAQLYNDITDSEPTAKIELLEIVREKVFPQSAGRIPRPADLEEAANIFASDSPEDIPRILALASDDAYATKANIVKAIGKHPSSEARQEGLQLVEDTLVKEYNLVFGEILTYFPKYQEGIHELHTIIEEGELSKKTGTYDDNYGRSQKLDVVAKICVGPHNKHRRGYESLYYTTLIKPIMSWLDVLAKWPDRAERVEVWERIRKCDDPDPFFSVTGFAKALSKQCV
jgi:hypothetical protein